MDRIVELAILARVVRELGGLLLRALEAGRTEVTDAELAEAFRRADAADDRWLDLAPEAHQPEEDADDRWFDPAPEAHQPEEDAD